MTETVDLIAVTGARAQDARLPAVETFAANRRGHGGATVPAASMATEGATMAGASMPCR